MSERTIQRRAWRDLIARHLGDVTEDEAQACLAMLEEATAADRPEQTPLNPEPCPGCGVRYTGPGHNHGPGEPQPILKCMHCDRACGH
jgi:hypothetical protein